MRTWPILATALALATVSLAGCALAPQSPASSPIPSARAVDPLESSATEAEGEAPDAPADEPAAADSPSGSLVVSAFNMEFVPGTDYVLTRHDPSDGSSEPLWPMEGTIGIAAPNYLTVSPDGKHAAYWSMQLSDEEEDVAEDDPLGLPTLDVSLVLRSLQADAEAVSLPGDAQGLLNLGTTWSGEGSSLWYVLPRNEETASPFQEHGLAPGTVLDVHRVDIEEQDAVLVGASDTLVGTIDPAELDAQGFQLLAASESLGRLALLDIASSLAQEPYSNEPIASRLLILDAEDLSVQDELRWQADARSPMPLASPDGRRIAILGAKGDPSAEGLRLWQLEDGSLSDPLATLQEIRWPLFFSATGSMLVWSEKGTDERGLGWRIKGMDDDALSGFVPVPSREGGPHPGGRYGSWEAIAVAPHAPSLLISAGTIGVGDDYGGQAREYRILDGRTGASSILPGMPGQERRVTVWTP